MCINNGLAEGFVFHKQADGLYEHNSAYPAAFTWNRHEVEMKMLVLEDKTLLGDNEMNLLWTRNHYAPASCRNHCSKLRRSKFTSFIQPAMAYENGSVFMSSCSKLRKMRTRDHTSEMVYTSAVGW